MGNGRGDPAPTVGAGVRNPLLQWETDGVTSSLRWELGLGNPSYDGDDTKLMPMDATRVLHLKYILS